MCYQAAGPKGSDIIGKASLTNAEIKKVIAEATAIPSLWTTGSIWVAGGAFLHVDNAIDLFHEASLAGYSEISTTTNCYWAKRPEKAAKVASRARRSGRVVPEISWDHWHKPFISSRLNLQCNPRVLRV